MERAPGYEHLLQEELSIIVVGVGSVLPHGHNPVASRNSVWVEVLRSVDAIPEQNVKPGGALGERKDGLGSVSAGLQRPDVSPTPPGVVGPLRPGELLLVAVDRPVATEDVHHAISPMEDGDQLPVSQAQHPRVDAGGPEQKVFVRRKISGCNTNMAWF